MAMHPNERPADVLQLRDELVGSQPRQKAATPQPYPLWQDALRRNRVLAGTTLGLALLALIVTLAAPRLPAVAGERTAPPPAATVDVAEP
jgi:hypothetical protein